MKLTLALCLAALCLSTYGQTNALPVPRDVWVYYQTMGTNIVVLRAKIDAIKIAWQEEGKRVDLQRQAGVDTSAANLARKDLNKKMQFLQQEIAELELKRFEIEQRYKMPSAAPVKPKPTKKPKP